MKLEETIKKTSSVFKTDREKMEEEMKIAYRTETKSKIDGTYKTDREIMLEDSKNSYKIKVDRKTN